MVSSAEIIRDFRRLTSTEKLALLDDLWREAVQDLDSGELSEGAKSFLDERIRDAEVHSDLEVEWEEFRTDLGRES